ncbi:hypothetical protein S7711_09815 [Stachybotrys chartarum IBT 7711]|uniref:Galactosyl transferase GMA12/MNN10 family protein n=1 Tax=Stachybotrys chartarum (strain CBS 109288 / IBT 7711) TaxID=1280523 RepID=A0A084B818_STACB|nr:hypothetical protein S7711_09815 [Stachybotrys chartarum IBT 7711]
MHGHLMFLQRQPMLDGYWTKPAFLLSIILRELARPPDERLRWLFWFDVDSVVLNYNTQLQSFLPPEHLADAPTKDSAAEAFRNINVLTTRDGNGLNNGVFPIRVNMWSAQLLAAVLAFRELRSNQDLPFQDQSAMEAMLREEKFRAHAVDVPRQWFNAYKGDVREGDFLVHLAGVEEREKHIDEWCSISEEKAPRWNPELQNASQIESINFFWDSWKQDSSSNYYNQL